MPPIKHALLGASSAHRWMVCTPSAMLDSSYEDKPSEAAAEGTLAHAIAEARLTSRLSGKRWAKTPKALKEDPLYRPGMDEDVDIYVDYILDERNRVLSENPEVLLEQRVDYSPYAPNGFGTADCLMLHGDKLDVFDFKYGKHVFVEAENNPQLKLYALGAMVCMDPLGMINTVRTHIIQPRMENIGSVVYTASELIEWGEKVVKPIAELASKGEGELIPGEHCTFCKHRFRCRARAEQQQKLNLIRYDGERVRTPDELSDEELAHVLEQVDSLKNWASSVKEYCLSEALDGNASFPGWKLVLGRSDRKITKPEEAIKILNKEGFSTDEVTKLKGIGDLEDLVGKKRFAELLAPVIEKPQGKPTLVKSSDPRPVFTNTKFSVIEENE